MEEQDNVHFLLLAAFSLATSILKYSSTSSTGVSSFFLVSLGVLFWAGALQGLEGPSSFGTYYLIIRALSFPTSNSLRQGGEVRSDFSFTLQHK